MIKLIDVSKSYRTRSGRHKVFEGLNLTIMPGEKVGILGRNGAGKSTLIRLLSGVENPDSGKIQRSMSISWPIAFSGGFQGSLSGIDNLKFICRVYGADIASTRQKVEEFSELGKFLYEPVKSYSSGMVARLAFALSMAVEFDCFLVDEVISVGDNRFQEKCRFELFEKRADRAMVLVSHVPDIVLAYCHKAYVLHEGRLFDFETCDQAYDFYNHLNF